MCERVSDGRRKDDVLDDESFVQIGIPLLDKSRNKSDQSPSIANPLGEVNPLVRSRQMKASVCLTSLALWPWPRACCPLPAAHCPQLTARCPRPLALDSCCR